MIYEELSCCDLCKHRKMLHAVAGFGYPCRSCIKGDGKTGKRPVAPFFELDEGNLFSDSNKEKLRLFNNSHAAGLEMKKFNYFMECFKNKFSECDNLIDLLKKGLVLNGLFIDDKKDFRLRIRIRAYSVDEYKED